MEKRVLLAVFLSFLVLVVYQSLPASSASGQGSAARRNRPSQAPAAGSRALQSRRHWRPSLRRLMGPLSPNPSSPASGTRHRRRDPDRPCDLQHSRSGPEELAVQALTTTTRASRSSSSRRRICRRTRNACFRCASPTARTLRSSPGRSFARARRASTGSSTDTQTLGFEYRDEAGLAVVKSFTFEPSHPYVVSFTVRAERSGRPLEASRAPRRARVRGPIAKLHIVRGARAGDLSRRMTTSSESAGRIFRTRSRRGSRDVSICRRRRALLHVRARAARRTDPHRVSGVERSGGRGSTGAVLRRVHCALPHRRRRTKRLFVGPKDFDVLQAVDPYLVQCHRLRHVPVFRRPAAARAEVDQRLGRELRVVDHHPDGVDQRGDVSASPQELRLHAQDAGDSARGEGDTGSLREAQDQRSQALAR